MFFSVFCSVVAIFYVIIWFFDSFFKSCMHYPYFAFLEGTGLKIGIFNFSWTTTAFNRCIFRWSKNLSRFLRRWFTCGYYVTVFLFLPFALWTLFSIIARQLFDYVDIGDAPEVKAMLPGINVPVSDFWVYFLSIALCSIIHELGHALAAALEDVQLISVGVYIFTIIPIAFVQMNTEHLNNLDVGKRLRIYCAGIWHNVMLAFVAILLFISTPVLFSLAYGQYNAVKVVELSNDSPLKAVRGLQPGNIITAVNRCEVRSLNDWTNCLNQAHERFGICTTAEYVSQHNEIVMENIKDDVVECCRKDDLYSLCFEYIEPKEVLESGLAHQYSCLKPRDMVTGSFKICTEANVYGCTKGEHCLKPSLNNHTYLIVVERRDDIPVVYLGLPNDIHKTVIVDEYFPRISILSVFSPSQFEKFLRYIFIFSMGIGFVNVIPCFGTDGHHIARNLIQIIAKRFGKDGNFVTFATICTVVVGTGLTVPLLVFLFYKAFFLEQ